MSDADFAPGPVFDSRACYRILLHGRLDAGWSEDLEGMTVTAVEPREQAPITMLTGWLLDQAALQGVLQAAYNLGLTILSVERTGSYHLDQGAS